MAESTQLARHITSLPNVCGGKLCIAGTRIRVWDIHVWHDRQGRSPAEIVADFPQLTVSDVYAALSYFLDYRTEIETDMAQRERVAEEMARRSGPSLIDGL